MVWSPPNDVRSLATVTGTEMPATGQEEEGTSLCWIDVVSRDLSEIANWEELV